MTGIARRDRVSNAGLREAYLERRAKGYLDATLVAHRLGWVIPDGSPDTSRVERSLGLRNDTRHAKRGPSGVKVYPPRKRETVSWQRAAELAEALGVDPWECGL